MNYKGQRVKNRVLLELEQTADLEKARRCRLALADEDEAPKEDPRFPRRGTVPVPQNDHGWLSKSAWRPDVRRRVEQPHQRARRMWGVEKFGGRSAALAIIHEDNPDVDVRCESCQHYCGNGTDYGACELTQQVQTRFGICGDFSVAPDEPDPA